FQAEDGIRVWSVTGVQTCALPIFRGSVVVEDEAFVGSEQGAGDELPARLRPDERLVLDDDGSAEHGVADLAGQLEALPDRVRVRSEERRVGKERRARWARDQRNTQ